MDIPEKNATDNHSADGLQEQPHQLDEKNRKLKQHLHASYERGNRLADQLSSLRAAVDMPELYFDNQWRIRGYSIHFPGITRTIVDSKDRATHLSEFLREGDFAKIEDYLTRVNSLKELPYEDGGPWELVYSGPNADERIGRHWVPNITSGQWNWRLLERDGRLTFFHTAHTDDDDECYLMTEGEFGDAETDIKIEYKVRTPDDAQKIRDLSVVLSGGSGNEAILPDSLGYTACTANDNSMARIQRETASTITVSERLELDTDYEITVERTGGRISRQIRHVESGKQLETLVYIDSKAIYDRQNHVGFHTFSGEAEFFDIRIYTRKSRFSIDQFRIPFNVEAGIRDPLVADKIYKLRLGMYSVRGTRLNSLIFDDITQNKSDHLALERSRQQLRSLSRYLQSVREQERARIAREIHDELGQILTAIKLDLSWIGLKLLPQQNAVSKKTTSMAETIDGAIRTVQKITGDLRPGLLDDLGLEAAIEWQADKFTEQTGISCDLHIAADDLEVSRDLATNLFRILQETLTNITRHAKASRVWVSFKQHNGCLILSVRDNGIGLPKEKVNHHESFGLMGIRERVIDCGGEVHYRSQPNKGTDVSVVVPLGSTYED
ncbi:MAG: sensor histidine kinase [Chloroflexi bacterium]|jgi:signal transduction histidine kinase|nr:sensor histidine kinase [Chloroflexota bacterium]